MIAKGVVAKAFASGGGGTPSAAFVGQVLEPATSALTDDGSGTAKQSYTVTIPTGSPSATRMLAIAIGWHGTAACGPVTKVTLDDVDVTHIVSAAPNNAAQENLYRIAKSTGTTATLKVWFTSTNTTDFANRLHVGVWEFHNLSSQTENVSSNGTTTAGSPVIPANSFAICAAMTTAATTISSWNNGFTERFSGQNETNTFGCADLNTVSGLTATNLAATFAAAGSASRHVMAAWSLA